MLSTAGGCVLAVSEHWSIVVAVFTHYAMVTARTRRTVDVHSSSTRFLPREAMPVSVRLSVTFVYCIQTAEDIVKLLSRPGSHIILVFDPERRYPTLREPLHRGVKYTGVGGKICNFRLKSPFKGKGKGLSRKRYETDPRLLWNVNIYNFISPIW